MEPTTAIPAPGTTAEMPVINNLSAGFEGSPDSHTENTAGLMNRLADETGQRVQPIRSDLVTVYTLKARSCELMSLLFFSRPLPVSEREFI
jgi:hypothetical protein